MSESKRCERCESALDAATGECPKCALELAIEAASDGVDDRTHGFRDPAAAKEAPERVGPYKILEKLGEGGMGLVFLAEQREPMRREVALKLIKLGMDTNEVIARFESERQALAIMSHPNVAKVLDAGATEGGRPYFVMEYISGESITDYCDRQRLSTMQRLELFLDVCRGVQHAHQKGLIHRDLKPSNVLVAVENDRPVPKIIDFGVAKATNIRLTEKTLFTRLGQLVGTPEYMSPEQAEPTSVDIDTRTDVYSLGVLLYELLAGALPFDSRDLRSAGYAEICRKIREDPLSKPSTRVGTLGDAAADVARHRGTDPGSLRRTLHGDLDWITMKALEKERGRRYDTPEHLAADIERHLRHEPVYAGPPSVAYRAKKFVRRHRVAVAVSFLLTTGLLLGATGLAVGLIRARRAEAHAVRQADVKKRVASFMKELFTLSTPEKSRGETITARELLDGAAAQIEDDATLDPLTRIELRTTIGDAFRSLGLRDEAEPVLARAVREADEVLSKDHPVRLESMHARTSLLREQGRHEDAELFAREVLERRRRVLGPLHEDTLDSTAQLAIVYYLQGLYDEAEPLYREAIDGQKQTLGVDDPKRLQTMSNLAVLYRRQSRLEEAEKTQADALDGMMRILGDDHPSTIYARNNLATVHWSLGRFDQALESYRAVLSTCRRVFGDDHPRTLMAMNNVGLVYMSLERYEEAESTYESCLGARRRQLGPDHPDTLRTQENLGIVYLNQSLFAEAAPLMEEVLSARRRVLGDEHHETLRSTHNYGDLLHKQGRLGEAESVYSAVLERERRILGDEHTLTLHTVHNLGDLFRSTGRPKEAEAYLREAFEKRSRVIGADHPDTLASRDGLVGLYRKLGREEEAELLLADGGSEPGN